MLNDAPISELSDLWIGETPAVVFNFTQLVRAGISIASVVSVSVVVMAGTDPNAAASIVGSAVISGAYVSQLVSPTVPNARYRYACTILTADGQKLTDIAELTARATNYQY